MIWETAGAITGRQWNAIIVDTRQRFRTNDLRELARAKVDDRLFSVVEMDQATARFFRQSLREGQLSVWVAIF
jgi:hypothetical protein